MNNNAHIVTRALASIGNMVTETETRMVGTDDIDGDAITAVCLEIEECCRYVRAQLESPADGGES